MEAHLHRADGYDHQQRPVSTCRNGNRRASSATARQIAATVGERMVVRVISNETGYIRWQRLERLWS